MDITIRRTPLSEARQAACFERTGIAAFCRLDARRVAPLIICMHLRKHLTHFSTQLLRQFDAFTPPRLAVIKTRLLDRAHQHLLQTHRLQTQLQTVRIAGLWRAALIFYRHRQILPITPVNGNAAVVSPELDDIALPAHAERIRHDRHAARDEEISALLRKSVVMRALVQDCALNGAQVLLPLALDMNQRPLPRTKGKMLNTGELQKIVVIISLHISESSASRKSACRFATCSQYSFTL